MFFIGATGQFLTLILSVCLSFVFLFSAGPKTSLLTETFFFENIQIQQETVSFGNNSFQTGIDSIENIDETKVGFENSLLQKVSDTKKLFKWKSFWVESSGNKAPPAFNWIYC